MAVFALSDLHLSFQVEKPMDVFGVSWQGYVEKIARNWKENVKENDIVLIPGDVSWGTYLEQSLKDFEWIFDLPGIKYISKGNHDYWWETVTKMTKFLSEHNLSDRIKFVYNCAFEAEEFAVCATKGFEKETEERLKARELIRLENSLAEGEKLGKKAIISMLHYPPFYKNGEPILEIFELFKKYNVHTCVYGHIHNKNHACPKSGKVDGVNIMLVSCDQVDFCPVRLAFL